MKIDKVKRRLLSDFSDYDPQVYEECGYLGIDLCSFSYWGVETESKYNSEIERMNAFEKLENKVKKVSVYFSFDVSGFDYWMKQMKEQQYLHVAIVVNATTLTPKQYSNLSILIGRFIDFAEEFVCANNFNPETL